MIRPKIRFNRPWQMPAVIVAVVCSCLAVFVLSYSHATTPAANHEAETGTVSSVASTVDDTSASGGKAVKFGVGSQSADCASSATNVPDGQDPWGGCWPGSSNTGVPTGTTLIQVPAQATSGSGWSWSNNLVHVSAGATVSGLDISGGLTGGDDITVRNSRIRCTNMNDYCFTPGAGSTITDTEIGGGTGTQFYSTIGVVCGNYQAPSSLTTFTRVNVHHVIQGFHQDGDCKIQDSYLHDFTMGDVCVNDSGCTGAHSESTFIDAGNNNSVIHSTVGSGNTADLFCQNNQGNLAVGTMTIEKNLSTSIQHNSQVPSFGVDIETSCAPNGASGIQVLNNIFYMDNWQVGPAQAPAGSVNSGNKFTDGTPITIFDS